MGRTEDRYGRRRKANGLQSENGHEACKTSPQNLGRVGIGCASPTGLSCASGGRARSVGLLSASFSGRRAYRESSVLYNANARLKLTSRSRIGAGTASHASSTRGGNSWGEWSHSLSAGEQASEAVRLALRKGLGGLLGAIALVTLRSTLIRLNDLGGVGTSDTSALSPAGHVRLITRLDTMQQARS